MLIFIILLNSTLIIYESINLVFLPLYALLLGILVNKLLFNSFRIIDLNVNQIYVFIAVILYYYFKHNLPEWHGFTGMYGAEGTDDSRFYAAISENSYILPKIANDYGLLLKGHGYSSLLKILAPSAITHPFLVVIPNIVGIASIPLVSSKLYSVISDDIKSTKIIYVTTFLCPFILSNGLILIRDGWTAFLFTSGLYFLIKKENTKLIIVLIILIIIRAGSGALLLLLIIFHHLYINKLFTKKNIYTIVITLFLFFFVQLYYSSVINEYILEKGISIAGRELYIQNYLNEYPDSIITKIYSKPILIRIPLGFIFFNFLPFLGNDFFFGNYFDPRKFLAIVILPLYIIVYNYLFISGVFRFKEIHYKVKFIFYSYILSIFTLSQFSLQYRHKTMIMPLFYIASLALYQHSTKNGRIIAFILVILFFILQIINFVR